MPSEKGVPFISGEALALNDLSALVRTFPSAIFVVRADERAEIMFANEAAVALFDLDPAMSDARDLAEFCTAPDALAAVAARLNDGTPVDDCTLRCRSARGREFFAQVSARLLDRDRGAAMLLSLRDVTVQRLTERRIAQLLEDLEGANLDLDARVATSTADLRQEIEIRRQTEASLRQSEQRLMSLLDAGSDWLWETDADHRFTMFSGRGELTGAANDRLLGATRWQIAADANQEAKWRRHRADLDRRVPFRDFTYLACQPERGIRHIRTSGTPMFDEAGCFAGYRGIATDITESIEAQARLHETSSILQSTFDSMEQGVAIFAADLCLLACNDRFRTLLPLTDDMPSIGETSYADVLRHVLTTQTPDSDQGRAAMTDHIRRAANGAADCFEVRLPHGAWRQLNANPMVGQGLVVTVTDVTALKEAASRQRALRTEAARVRRQLREAIEAMSEGFVLYDAEDRLVMFNRRYRDEFSFAPEALVPGMRYEDILRSGSRQVPLGYDPERWIAERLEGHREPPPPFLVERADGRWTLMTEYRTKEGGIVGIRTDVTELKQRERAAQAQERLLRELVDAVPAAIHTKDRDLRYQLVNRYFLKLWNLAPEQVEGRTQREAFQGHLSAAYGTAADERDRLVLESGRATGFYEVSYPGSDGQQLTLWSNKLPLIDVDGALTGVLTVGIDVTELKRAQREIEQQREALHQSEKLTALGSLLAGVAHELNNPLSIVVGRATMLEEQVTDPWLVDRIGKIRVAAERCGRIVKTFLAMARQKRPSWRKAQINDVIADAVELLSYGLRASDIRVELDLAPDLPVALVDRDELSQVFANLLVNAEQALSQSGPPRRIAISTREKPAGMIQIAFSDNGPGIPDAVRHRVFEPFFTTKPTGIGTGIGLSVCRGIVLAHGGSIDVESTSNVGTTFVVRLPLREAPPSPEDAPSPIMSHIGSRRILVVDDEPEITEMVAEMLRGAGHEVDAVQSGTDALDCLERLAYDLVVADLRMPGLDGRELFERAIRLRPSLSRRFLFLTGDTLSPLARRFLEEAGRRHLRKPVTPDELRTAVEEVITAALD